MTGAVSLDMLQGQCLGLCCCSTQVRDQRIPGWPSLHAALAVSTAVLTAAGSSAHAVQSTSVQACEALSRRASTMLLRPQCSGHVCGGVLAGHTGLPVASASRLCRRALRQPRSEPCRLVASSRRHCSVQAAANEQHAQPNGERPWWSWESLRRILLSVLAGGLVLVAGAALLTRPATAAPRWGPHTVQACAHTAAVPAVQQLSRAVLSAGHS